MLYGIEIHVEDDRCNSEGEERTKDRHFKKILFSGQKFQFLCLGLAAFRKLVQLKKPRSIVS